MKKNAHFNIRSEFVNERLVDGCISWNNGIKGPPGVHRSYSEKIDNVKSCQDLIELERFFIFG